MKCFTTIVIVSVLFIIVTVCQSVADVYKWVDSNGVTHFSEFPPQDRAVEKFCNSTKSTTDESRRTSGKHIKKQKIKQNKTKEKVTRISKSDLAGKWKHAGISRSLTSKKISKPYKPQSWHFRSSGIVKYYIGNKSNSFPYKIKGNEIITTPFQNETKSFFVVSISSNKMIWRDPDWNTFIHVVKKY